MLVSFCIQSYSAPTFSQFRCLGAGDPSDLGQMGLSWVGQLRAKHFSGSGQCFEGCRGSLISEVRWASPNAKGSLIDRKAPQGKPKQERKRREQSPQTKTQRPTMDTRNSN